LSIPIRLVRRHAVRHPGRTVRREEPAVKYMLLIYGAQPTEPPSEAEVQKVMDAYWAYEKEVSEAGVMISSDALQDVTTATTVQVTASGERLVTDGPFAETREVLGGYYLLDVPDLDAAIDWAARCPGSQFGSRIEVRPIMEFEQP
jgi:hypothetical protein